MVQSGRGTARRWVSGSTTFSHDLDEKIIIRRSRAEFAPGPGTEQGPVHEDLLIIYRQPGESQFRAIYFDNEGHVIRSSVSLPARQPAVVFESEASGRSPTARLVYEAAQDGSILVEFFVTAPDGELTSHVKGIVERDN